VTSNITMHSAQYGSLYIPWGMDSAQPRCRGENEMYLRKYKGYTHDKGRHKKAVIAVARQRVSILWAMLRDGRLYEKEYNPREKTAGEVQAA